MVPAIEQPRTPLDAQTLDRVAEAMKKMPPDARSIGAIASAVGLPERTVAEVLDAVYARLPPVKDDDLPPITRAALGIAGGFPDHRPYKERLAEAIDEKHGTGS